MSCGLKFTVSGPFVALGVFLHEGSNWQLEGYKRKNFPYEYSPLPEGEIRLKASFILLS